MRQAWRRFAHNFAWFALCVAVLVILGIMLFRP